MEYITLGLIGLIFGSFITMLSYRIVNGGGYVGRSKCPKCGHKLAVLDLIPVFSWVWQGGKCRYCKKGISWRYPMTEILTALAFIGLANYWQDKFLLLVFSAMSMALITMIVVDFEHMIIPDEIQVALAAIALIYAFYIGNPLMEVMVKSLLCLAIALLLKYGFLYFTNRDGLGLGDVKFFAVAGIFLPLEALSAFFLLSGICGILIALVWRILHRGERFPFGPALALSLYLCMVFPKVAKISDIFGAG